MRHNLSKEKLQTILRARSVEAVSRSQLRDIVCREPGPRDFRPENFYQIDPRNGLRIIYNASRAKRPHNNTDEKIPAELDLNEKASPISEGKTTGVVDIANLSEGFTFININLYPILYPSGKFHCAPEEMRGGANPRFRPISGMHFLQWTSSYQDRDWHNMPLEDCKIVMQRLAKLEKTLLTKDDDEEGCGYVSIIKNCGSLVGGSIAQGHQQIGFSTMSPNRTEDLVRFERRYGSLFSSYMMEKNPPSLFVKDYGSVVLMVPYFMRRPYEAMLFLKDASKKYIHQLDDDEIGALALAWKEVIKAMRTVITSIGRELAYNILSNTGPGAGIHFEFLPYTQETGGFEHLGLYVCQANPEVCAEQLRKLLA